MKKLVTIAVVGALAFGLLGPAEAKKKKKPKAPVPVEVQYFLRMDEDCAAFLSVTDGEETSDCFFGVDDMLNEYEPAQAVIGDPVDHYVAADGLPLTLDPSRKVVGTITFRGWTGGVGWGVGNAEVDITLKATIAGEEKELGTVNHSYTAGPNHVETVEFEITLDPALAGAVAEGLTLDVYTHGNVLFGRGVEHDFETPPSIKIPALK